jgi:hypothetical protein
MEIIDLTQDSDTDEEDDMEMDDEEIIHLQGDGDEDMDVEKAVDRIHGDDEEGREDVAVEHAGLKWSEWRLPPCISVSFKIESSPDLPTNRTARYRPPSRIAP